ncbi:hypothetical protein PPL_04172 [Heterostelium album PN500]|uniref:Uncharacterized protein n=1 Tax=Heterostelium pallidum (strain ATCC 26659 / Pp 5 / PN500) TaxID=670386 RepID=D3B681_HETP5|nr:hypothetical protein PPL_04172 [Heterostelium album PN500]EFA83379.1 hypothetical protein PPL_04172 [Heterostelium album PN500]|eukprot:XP_020435496.1 hypothetical protein PPL_04172 [Heterostelium album PN500]
MCQIDMCGIQGADCKSNAQCAPGFRCEGNSTCTTARKEGDICIDDNECAFGLKCVNSESNSKCRNAKYVPNGGACTYNYQCLGSMSCDKQNKCSLNEGTCSMNEECPHGEYCKQGHCKKMITLDADCNFPEDICEYPNICSATDGRSTKGKCKPMFSKQPGDTCFAQFGECNMAQGYSCPSSGGAISSCQPILPGINCVDDSGCDPKWSVCSCGSDSSNTTCQNRIYFDNTCQTEYSKYRECLVRNRCPYSNSIEGSGQPQNSRSSCDLTHCGNETVCFYAACLRTEFPCGVPKDIGICAIKFSHPKAIAGPSVFGNVTRHGVNGTVTGVAAGNATVTPGPKGKNDTHTDLNQEDGKNSSSRLMVSMSAVFIAIVTLLLI